jgi:AAA ATPase domain
VIAASAARAACASAGCCAALSRDGGLPAALKVFVGRSAELDLLTSTHGRVIATGEPHLVTILGEPGVGTTSLVGELRGRLGESPAWHLGRCLDYGRERALGEQAATAFDALGRALLRGRDACEPLSSARGASRPAGGNDPNGVRGGC